MSQFSLAFQYVLQHEGGLVNDENDPGGITNKGISLRYLKALVKNYPYLMPHYDLDRSASINSYDIEHISAPSVHYIYLQYWWKKYRYGELYPQSIATKVFDSAVNIGPAKVVRLLQTACCEIAGFNCLKIDGILGDKTIYYINHLSFSQQSLMLAKLCQLIAEHYHAIVKKNSNFKKFLKGWLKRAYAIPKDSEEKYVHA